MFNVVSSGQWPAGYLINPNVEPLDQKWLKAFSKTHWAGDPTDPMPYELIHLPRID